MVSRSPEIFLGNFNSRQLSAYSFSKTHDIGFSVGAEYFCPRNSDIKWG